MVVQAYEDSGLQQNTHISRYLPGALIFPVGQLGLQVFNPTNPFRGEDGRRTSCTLLLASSDGCILLHA